MRRTYAVASHTNHGPNSSHTTTLSKKAAPRYVLSTSMSEQ